MNYKDKFWNNFETSFLKTFSKEVPIYTPSVFREYRGEIFTTYHTTEHPVSNIIPNNLNIHSRFSKSYKNVLRGLHYDSKTYKLVQSLVGEIYFVVLDYRVDSPTFGKWESYILSEKTRDQILVPPGFANGHYALTDCIFHYTMFYSGDYVDENKQGVIKWKEFEIEWPNENPILQKRDKL
jgi:dTDP-4-dehydrorhamnose 3,5-epimerase